MALLQGGSADDSFGGHVAFYNLVWSAWPRGPKLHRGCGDISRPARSPGVPRLGPVISQFWSRLFRGSKGSPLRFQGRRLRDSIFSQRQNPLRCTSSAFFHLISLLHIINPTLGLGATGRLHLSLLGPPVASLRSGAPLLLSEAAASRPPTCPAGPRGPSFLTVCPAAV